MRRPLLPWFLAAVVLPLAAQGAEPWRFGLQLGLNVPTHTWAERAKSGVQISFTAAHPVDEWVALGFDGQLFQGDVVHAGVGGAGHFNTFALLPEVFLSLGELENGSRWHGLAGAGLARVSEEGGWRADLQPTRDGSVTTDTYGGDTLWSTVRPVYQVGFGVSVPLKGRRRMLVELRYQRIQLPGLALTSVPLTVGLGW
jgi:hypothetical protein